MENVSTSITIPDSFNQTPSTSEVIKGTNINQGYSFSLITILTLLSILSITGSPATTKNTNLSDFTPEKTISIIEYKDIEKKLKEKSIRL